MLSPLYNTKRLLSSPVRDTERDTLKKGNNKAHVVVARSAASNEVIQQRLLPPGKPNPSNYSLTYPEGELHKTERRSPRQNLVNSGWLTDQHGQSLFPKAAAVHAAREGPLRKPLWEKSPLPLADQHHSNSMV